MCGVTAKSQDDSSSSSMASKRKLVSRGILYGSLSVFISFMGASLTFPFLQEQRDKLGCDALCYGTMQSTRAGLTLLGSVLVGRLSDRLGRRIPLYIGLASSISGYLISLHFNSINGMWLAMIPTSLLNQNFNVLKALFADYNADIRGSESERASALGRLGMAVGISFMIGPMIGTTLLKTYPIALSSALVLTIVAGLFLFLLPVPQIALIPTSESNALLTSLVEKSKDDKNKDGLLSFFLLPAAQTPGARLLFFMRSMMGLAFNVFMTIWTVSLKARFAFGAKDHAYFMGWVGLWYALSQGVLAKVFIKMSGEDPTVVLLLCVAGLGLGRVLAMMTTSIVAVYVIMGGVIVALGVLNTAMATAISRLAPADQTGGLFGVMEAVESASGLVGPILGGLLFRCGPNVPLATVVAIYSLVFVAVYMFYKETIVLPTRGKKTATADSDDVPVVTDTKKDR